MVEAGPREREDYLQKSKQLVLGAVERAAVLEPVKLVEKEELKVIGVV